MPTMAEVRQQFPQYQDMPDSALADALHSKFYSDMPKEDFAKKIGFSPESAPVKATPLSDYLPSAITDIPHEIGRTASANLDTIQNGLTNRASKGSIEGLMDTGKAVMAVPGLIASPITGALRSLIGHPMAQAEHAAGSLIAPDIAAKDDPQKMYDAAAGDVETALSAAKPSARAPVVKPPAAPELKAAAKAVYNDPAIKAIDIPPADVAGLATKIENSLLQRGNRPTLANAPGTFAEVKNLYPGNDVQAVKVDDLRSARRALNITAKQIDPATFKPTSDAEAATHSIAHIDNFLDNLAPELKTANANYAAAKGADRLDYRMAKAEHRAARAGIGGNLENVMRQEADKIPNRGLTADEQAARDQIVLGTPTRNALRVAGKAGVDGGLSLALHLGSGIMSGGATAPITLAGTMARKLGEHLTKRDMGRLSEQIRSRAPLAKALAGTTQTPQISQKAKTLAAALMGRSAPGLTMPRSILPANADQNQ